MYLVTWGGGCWQQGPIGEARPELRADWMEPLIPSEGRKGKRAEGANRSRLTLQTQELHSLNTTYRRKQNHTQTYTYTLYL